MCCTSSGNEVSKLDDIPTQPARLTILTGVLDSTVPVVEQLQLIADAHLGSHLYKRRRALPPDEFLRRTQHNTRCSMHAFSKRSERDDIGMSLAFCGVGLFVTVLNIYFNVCLSLSASYANT